MKYFLDIPDDLWKKFKIHCAEKGSTMKDKIIELIKKELNMFKLLPFLLIFLFSCSESKEDKLQYRVVVYQQKLINQYRVAVYQLEGTRRTYDRLVSRGVLPKGILEFPKIELPEEWRFLVKHYEQNKKGIYKDIRFRWIPAKYSAIAMRKK